MPSFYSWLLRLLLSSALCVLSITVVAVWPTDNVFRWIDLAGVASMSVATLMVAIWTAAAWFEDFAVDPRTEPNEPPAKALPPASAPQA